MPYYFYLSWSFNSYMPFSLRYFCSDYIIHKESEINKSPPANNDRIDHKNWSVRKKKYKVIKQVYHVKKDGRLIKNSDLTLDKEKPIVEEISASFIDPFVPNINHTSKDIAEQQSSSAVGQDKKQKSGNKPTSLFGTQTGLTGTSSESESSSKSKIKPSFNKLLAKYEKQGATQKEKKQRGRPSEAKDEKT